MQQGRQAQYSHNIKKNPIFYFRIQNVKKNLITCLFASNYYIRKIS